LFLYIGYISLQSAIDDPRRAARASGLLAIVGVINLPIIYYSVKWWNTLHQGASVSPTMAPRMAEIMVNAMLIMTIAFWMYTIAIVLMRVRRTILERERQTSWVKELVGSQPGADSPGASLPGANPPGEKQ
jgi:heme exporter protein C